MNISYEHYKVFYTVAKYKSFTRAAEATLSNQSNLTRTVKNLEKQLGCILFERTNKGVRLTEDGQELYRHIGAAFEHIQAGEEAVRAKHNMEQGVVKIGATEIALRCYLLPILQRYHKEYPGIRIKILNLSTPQALKTVENGLVDFAVVTTPMEFGTKLKTTTLSTFREVPICSENFHIEKEVPLERLAEHPIISLGAGTSTFDFYANEFAKRNCRFSPDIEAATADQIVPLVKYGLGIGFVPVPFLETEKELCQIPLRDACFTREIVLVAKKEQSLPLPAKELVKLMKAPLA